MTLSKYRAPRVSERSEQAAIVKFLRLLGASVYVLGTTRRKGDYAGTMQSPGLPDVIAFMPLRKHVGKRRLVMIECKRKGGRLRPEQKVFAEECFDAEVEHLVGGLDAVMQMCVEDGYIEANRVGR